MTGKPQTVIRHSDWYEISKPLPSSATAQGTAMDHHTAGYGLLAIILTAIREPSHVSTTVDDVPFFNRRTPVVGLIDRAYTKSLKM